MQTPTLPAQFLTEEQVIELCHSSRFAMKRFRERSADPIPHVKIGRRFLYDPRALHKWLERQARRGRNEAAY